MKNHFAIAPWEYPGADFDPAPHAQTRLDIGGKKRTLWLKMREGVIFFREPTLAPVYAVPKRFDQELAGDPEKLVFEWQREAKGDNYGAYFVSHRKCPGTPAYANYCLIVRPDNTGWMKEHFDEEWREIAPLVALKNPLWIPKPTYSYTSEQICKKMRPQFLKREVDARHFQTLGPHWNHDPHEMVSVLRSTAILWLPTSYMDWFFGKPLDWQCKSNSPFRDGAVMGHLTSHQTHRPNVVWDIVKWHYGFVGVQWKRASDHPELIALYKPTVWQKGYDAYGENWRGNWIGSAFETTLTAPPLSTPTHHDKLEAALCLRDFLADKMPADKLAMWIQDALNQA